MTDREQYAPGPASGAQVRKDGEKWTLILVRELRHSPEKVWQALTDPAHLREWAPFEADGNLGAVGTTVKLSTVGAPTPHVTETTVTRADAPKVLEYNWGGQDMRWELEASGSGTRLTLWHELFTEQASLVLRHALSCLDSVTGCFGAIDLARPCGSMPYLKKVVARDMSVLEAVVVGRSSSMASYVGHRSENPQFGDVGH